MSPPPGLRGEILAAMGRTTVKQPSNKILWRFGLPAAAAAGIALAFLLSGPGSEPADSLVTNLPAAGGVVLAGNLLTISSVQDGFIKAFESESPNFVLDLKNRDHQALFDHLKSAKLPCPTRCLPNGLKDADGVG